MRPVPFMLLMPAWLAGTDYWQEFVRALASVMESSPGRCERSIFCESGSENKKKDIEHRDSKPERYAGISYICPSMRYSFSHPEATGKTSSPFHAVWFCGGWESPKARRQAMAALKSARRRGQLKVFRSSSMLRKHGYFTKACEKSPIA